MSAENKHSKLTEDNFEREVLQSDQVVLVDFSADWCGPCRTIAPIVEELAADFEGVATVGKVDIDQNARLAERYSILSIPTLLFFRDGEVVDTIQGLAPKSVLTQKLEQLTSASPQAK